MWSKKTHSETILKESLLRQLSHAVKEVQLYHSQTSEICSTQEGTSSLISVLEAIFLHALKRSLFESAMRSVSVTDDAKPTPSFYDAVQKITHKDTVALISKLPMINNDVGRSRAWMRLALNEAAVSSYLAVIITERMTARHYRPGAFLRDKETMETAARLLDGLLPIRFEIPINSSLLNTWNAEPLLMSGLWSPALRDTVQVAVDVAGRIEDEESCSEMTASSSMRSLLTLDESQALQLILDTHMPIEEQESMEEVVEQVDPIEDRPRDEHHDIMQRSFSYLLESCSPAQDSAMPVESLSNIVKDFEPGLTSSENNSDIPQTIYEVQVQPTSEPIKQEDDFNTLVCSTFGNTNTSESTKQFGKTESTKENLEYNNRNRNLCDIIIKIPKEIGLQMQRFECADCRLSIGLSFGPANLCHVTGENLCDACHMSEVSVVPSRIIYNWDYTRYPTGKRASEYILSTLADTIYDLEKLNPKLYIMVKELGDILQLRKRLRLLNVYLKTCQQPLELSVRSYLLETTHSYSLADLLAVPGGGFQTELLKLINKARNHVVSCWICRQKGFICEVCRDPNVIYPFDAGSVYRCNKCKAVYHGGCITNAKTCRKCKRRKQRESEGDE